MLSRQIKASALLALSLCAIPAAQAGESRIELTDGSVITGELLGIEANHYRIRSATLGTLSVPESSIQSIQPMSAAGASTSQPGGSAAAPDYSADIAAIQKQLMTDQGLMDQVTALQQDPDIQQALSDPELTRMILSGDLQGLRADPRFQRLMQHPSIQALMGQVIGR
ncbi:hypothetical protein G3480_14195 [Thiorhodococcus mannitoliphagus]|uniref:STI1 domain-containing protein n=1 Tax=Thiorhodococcus mannitoliphagus TaxID=329406 RepID=A0A6P1DZ66_9GAMM|nr:hypothetical protein [Thiorhodococcus mannitoliphagus]NEX21452.1 hypothetical protein [Thiorhodococcus mannitoliphagus]